MRLPVSLLFAATILLSAGLEGLAQSQVKVSSSTFGRVQARQIGPALMSGRVTSVDALQSNPLHVYIGTASGGLWKSTNGGVIVKPVFDKHTLSIGTVTIDQQRPDTVWVGTGETWTRNSVSIGTGVYKSIDGGNKWKPMGLENTERISRIIIHPENPDIVYVAAIQFTSRFIICSTISCASKWLLSYNSSSWLVIYAEVTRSIFKNLYRLL